MAPVHMSEAELARDLHGVLVKGRLLSECIALAEARGTTAIPDEGFMQDVAEGIAESNQPWNPPSWKQTTEESNNTFAHVGSW